MTVCIIYCPPAKLSPTASKSMAKAHKLDGLVMLGSCDKIIPGMLMGCIRANIPAIWCREAPCSAARPSAKRSSPTVQPSPRHLGCIRLAKLNERCEKSGAGNTAHPAVPVTFTALPIL
ncbi:MAG: dihydroxy-acid dehydratase [Lutisporaceae bacterium]